MKALHFLGYVLLLSTLSCYNITHRFHEAPRFSYPEICEIIDLDMKNFFALKIKRTNSNKIIDSKGDTTYADITYHIFDQVTSRNNTNEFISEETYLYLHDIDKAYGRQRGRAVYFTTYVLLNEYYKEKYLNNQDYIFSGVIREIKVGYWYKEGDNLSLYFKQKDKSAKKTEKLIGFKGTFKKNELEENTFILNEASTVATAKGFRYINNQKIPDIDEQLLYLDIDRVFNLKKEKGLHFLQIAEGRKFCISPFPGKKEVYWKEEEQRFNRPPDIEKEPICNGNIDQLILSYSSKANPYRDNPFEGNTADRMFFRNTTNKIFYRFGTAQKKRWKKKKQKKKDAKYFSILTWLDEHGRPG